MDLRADRKWGRTQISKTHPPHKVLSQVTEIVRSRDVRMGEEVLVWVLRFITVPEK